LLALEPPSKTQENQIKLSPDPLYSTGTSTTNTKENKSLPRQLQTTSQHFYKQTYISILVLLITK
jgi:hypothetical protein